MFCTNCGNPVDEGAAFCTKCGAKTNATVESSDANSAPQCPASDSKRSLVSKMKALLIAGSTEATDEDVEAVLDAQDPDRHLPFKARTKAKWNRVCDKTRRLLADFGIGPDASSEGPAPAYGLWRNTLTWFVAFMTLFLLIGIVIIWIVEPMGMEPPPLGKGGKSVAAAFVYLLVRRIRKPIGNLLFPVAAVEKANAEGDWSAAHAASKKLRRRLIVGTCIFGVLVLLSLRGGSRDDNGRGANASSLTQTEKAIVGTWIFAKSMDIDPDDDDDASSIYLEGEETYRKDRTFRENGIMKFKFVHDGEITILEYGFSGKGKWKADAKRLVETEDSDDVVFTFKSASSYPKDSGDRQYIASLRDIVEDQFRATLSEQDDETAYVISKLTNDRMVLVDEDGDETTYRRKK